MDKTEEKPIDRDTVLVIVGILMGVVGGIMANYITALSIKYMPEDLLWELIVALGIILPFFGLLCYLMKAANIKIGWKK